MVAKFTPEEAQALIDIAQSAPLRDMRHASQVSVLLQKFRDWYNATGSLQIEGDNTSLIGDPTL
jgi:hypothetical protein